MPLVSVLLPFRNAEKTLELAATSILNQTFSDIELILVDNASEDQSADVAKRIVHNDARACYVFEPNEGVVAATDAGYRMASGKYVGRMDADDIALPGKLNKQIECFVANPGVAVVACCVEYGQSSAIEGGGIERYTQWTNSVCSFAEIHARQFVESPVVNPSAIIKRSVIENYGYYTDGDFPEDYELWLRYLSLGLKIEKVPEVLLRWNDSVTRLTRTDYRYSTDAFYELKTLYLARYMEQNGLLQKKLAVWGAGRVSRKRSSLLSKYGIAPLFYIDIAEHRPTNVLSYRDLRYDPDLFILTYVANWDAREQIQDFLCQRGFVEGFGFLCMS